MPPPPFHVQSLLAGEEVLPQHDSVSALWEHKWRGPCSKGQYPFAQGNIKDFEPIFQQLIEVSNDNNAIFQDADAYAQPFLGPGNDLLLKAEEAERNGEHEQAKDLFLRASTVFRIARFPITRRESRLNWQAWESGKAAYIRASKYFESPVQEVSIPFSQVDTSAGNRESDIPVYLRMPCTQSPAEGWPILIFICGLDAYRTDQTMAIDQHLADGFAVLCMEIPGTGDCPAAPRDPKSPDRLFGSVFEWIFSTGKISHKIDTSRIFVRGNSTGSYYAIRLAHTHADKLVAAVGQGTWSHYALSSDWLTTVDRGEYPFGLSSAFGRRLGFSTLEEALDDDIQGKFSLKLNGLLDQPSCRLLLVNGIEDSVFPIEDSLVVASQESAKDVRLVEDAGHMGRPKGESILNEWLRQRFTESRVSRGSKASTRSHPLKLVSVNNAPERARRLIGRVIEDVKDRYDIVHAANVEDPANARVVFHAVYPDLVFAASMWTPDQSAKILAEAHEVNPRVKTLAIPEGLQVDRGPDAVVEWLEERVPDLLSQ